MAERQIEFCKCECLGRQRGVPGAESRGPKVAAFCHRPDGRDRRTPAGKEVPTLRKEDVMVLENRQRLSVTDSMRCQDVNAGLEFFVLIDDASETRIGTQFP